MKRSMAALLLALVFVLSLAPCAQADAGVRVELNRFEIYSGYALDRATGEWSVRSNQAYQALQLIERNAAGYADSFVLFDLELTGNLYTGRVTPVLNVTYVGAKTILPTSVSFLVGRARYDYTVRAAEGQLGREHAEQIRVPLDQSGVNMLRRISQRGKVQLSLGGGAGKCSVTCEAKDSYKTPLDRVRGLSLEGLAPMLAELDNMGFSDYDLFDLNAAQWRSAGEYEGDYQSVTLPQNPSDTYVDLKNYFQTLSPGASGQSVIRLQNRLMELGYLSTSAASGTYAEGTAEAVRQAQKYYGLLQTGNADQKLVERLFAPEQTPGEYAPSVEDEVPAQAVSGKVQAVLAQPYRVSGAGELALNRSWFAYAVCATGENGLGAQRAASSKDHVLLVADGAFTNLSPSLANLYSAITAKAVYDGGYEYEAYAVCQVDGGERFDTSMLPLDQARLVIYAEIPAGLAGERFQLQIQLGDAELVYDLD